MGSPRARFWAKSLGQNARFYRSFRSENISNFFIIFSILQIPTLPPEHFDEAFDRFAGGRWRKMRGLQYLTLQRKREVMERQEDYATWEELCQGFASKPKDWKIWVKKLKTEPPGWDQTHHPPWPPGGATVFHATLPSANRSDTKASEYANDKHPMV